MSFLKFPAVHVRLDLQYTAYLHDVIFPGPPQIKCVPMKASLDPIQADFHQEAI